MKVCLFTDNHWCSTSSIVRQQGKKYSLRLENQIDSLNWVEQLALNNHCQEVWSLGDFFDKNMLGAEEVTALHDIKWNGLYHRFLVGNHELSLGDGTISSAHLFNLIPNSEVIDRPAKIDIGNLEVCFLPYILESNRKTIGEYFGPIKETCKRLILSHNDLAGIQMGAFKSVIGFDLDDITTYSHLFLNGHLHNGGLVKDGIINLGNLTGQNFSEDATQYSHCAYILDLDTLELAAYENPYAFNFYKIDASDRTKTCLFDLKPNAVVSLIVFDTADKEAVQNWLKSQNVVASRVSYRREPGEFKMDITDLTVDHLVKFKNFILEKVGNDDITISEIEEVIK